jgi:2,4'-dihydroxyacetophenone dioxygenase
MNDKWIPYKHPQPAYSPPEMILENAVPIDERLWVPLEENVWFRPLLLSASHGYWTNLLRVRRSGVLSRHRHPKPVHAYVIKGEWRYLEHDWVAREGSYAYEAPGETHTLVVDSHVEEMITLFHVDGALIYVDPEGNTTGYDDVFTRIAKAKAHYISVGFGESFIEQQIR